MLRHRRIIRRTVVNRIDRADDPIFGISGARNTTTSAGPDLRKGNIQMMSVRRAAERGQTTTGWLDSRHRFSFGRYRHPDHTGFRALRAINEDRVHAGPGFDAHRPRDMEIRASVLEGALDPRDKLGTSSVL